MNTLYRFFQITRAKAYIFLGLCAYFLCSLLMIFPVIPESIQNIFGSLFIPAIYVMIAVIRFLGPIPFGMRYEKGPNPSDGEILFSWIFTFLFGVFLLYVVACALGMWYESVHRRVNK